MKKSAIGGEVRRYSKRRNQERIMLKIEEVCEENKKSGTMMNNLNTVVTKIKDNKVAKYRRRLTCTKKASEPRGSASKLKDLQVIQLDRVERQLVDPPF
ncbi:beta-1,3-galactosyltransferase 7-like [Dorcoceras hygrometricum]|uniref:Beta-1,3-galactosyltransferase 7-like n=1 Tax=Dorcoceras hygrometricum TaxID=472368 RepID=A0A2Z7CCX7_9LAMI|nr:beta-1,3-galactosyltransferase 7-like [Dorcoceras hygrometricum]